MNKIMSLISLIRLNKPIGIFLLLWPTFWALWLSSNGVPDLRILIIFISGVVLTRSLGCAVNDFLDREIDIKVFRTKNRPLALKKISTERNSFIYFAISNTFIITGISIKYVRNKNCFYCINFYYHIPTY